MPTSATEVASSQEACCMQKILLRHNLDSYEEELERLRKRGIDVNRLD